MNSLGNEPPVGEPADLPDPAMPRTGVRSKYLAFMVAGLTLLAVSIGLVLWKVAGDGPNAGDAAADYEVVGEPIISDGGNTITYVIPNGTRARIAAGEELAVIPAKVTVKVGQTLIMRNEDTDAHIAGPFFVGPGQESTYSFSEPKVIEGDCTIHPSGSFEIEVVAA